MVANEIVKNISIAPKKFIFFVFAPLSSRQRKRPKNAIILKKYLSPQLVANENALKGPKFSKKYLSPQLAGDENERKSSHPLIFNCELFCKKTNKFVKINYPFDR